MVIAGQAGTQVIVDVSGNTGAFAFERALALGFFQLKSFLPANCPKHTGPESHGN
jgi:hypothetical protein